MATQVTFHKRVPQGSRGSLAELMARQAEAARASTSAQDIQTPTIMQGLGKLGMIGAGVFNERRAAKAEASSREALAKLIAGVGEGGATQQQVADMGLYDQDLANQYREEAVAARVRADELARKEADYKRDIGRQDFEWNRTQQDQATDEARQAAAAARVTTDERAYKDADQIADEARQAAAAAGVEANKRDYEGGIRIQTRNQTLADDRTQFLRDQAETIRKEKQEAAAAAAKPSGPLGQLMSDVQKFNNGAFGDPLDPQNQAMFKAAFAHNAAVPKGMTLTTNPDGTFTLEQGGVEGEGGGIIGSKKDVELQAAALESYRAAATAGNDLLPALQAAKLGIAAAGPTGPGFGYYSQIDDIMESYGPYVGFPKDWTLPGTSEGRAVLEKGSLAQVLENVQKTKGAVTDVEMELFRNASLNSSRTPEANQMLAEMGEAIIQRSNERLTEAEAWVKAHPEDGDLRGFEQHWNAKIAADPILIQDESGALRIRKSGDKAQQSPTEAPVAAPAPPAAVAAPAPAAPAGGAPAAGGGAAPVPGWTMEEWNALDEEDRKELLKPKTGLP